METLTLPEPARTLWLAKREIVHDLPDEGTGRKVIPHLGGGTTLAARWKHRVSTDIDILLPGRNTLIDLAQDNDENIARRLGGSPVAVGGSRIKVGFAEGEIDLTTLRPMPSEGHKESEVEGRTEIVLMNAQILRGKLQRPEKLLVRDVVDVIVASKADPASLATAVSLLGHERAGAIQGLWTNANEDLAKDFEKRIRDLDPRFGVDRKTVGSTAARLLSEHRYRRIEIGAEGDRLTIRENDRNRHAAGRALQQGACRKGADRVRDRRVPEQQRPDHGAATASGHPQRGPAFRETGIRQRRRSRREADPGTGRPRRNGRAVTNGRRSGHAGAARPTSVPKRHHQTGPRSRPHLRITDSSERVGLARRGRAGTALRAAER